MTHWYDDPHWAEWFKEADVLSIGHNNNTRNPLPPLKYYNDYNFFTFHAAWEKWGIPTRIQNEWEAMIQKAFYTPLEARKEPQ